MTHPRRSLRIYTRQRSSSRQEVGSCVVCKGALYRGIYTSLVHPQGKEENNIHRCETIPKIGHPFWMYHTLDIKGLGDKDILGGMIPPVARAERDPGADNSPPRPRGQDTPIRNAPGSGAGPQERRASTGTTDGRGGGRASPAYTSSNVAGDLGDLNEEHGRRAPREGQPRSQLRTGSGRPGHADGAGSVRAEDRNRQRNRRNQEQT